MPIGSQAHIYRVYYNGRDYILDEVMNDNMSVGLQLLRGFIIANWDVVLSIMNEEEII